MRMITRPLPAPNPRSEMEPAAPPDTPYPDTFLEVTKSPGTCSMRTGMTAFSSLDSIVCLPTTETGVGSASLSTDLRVPVMTDEERVSVCACAPIHARRAAAATAALLKSVMM